MMSDGYMCLGVWMSNKPTPAPVKRSPRRAITDEERKIVRKRWPYVRTEVLARELGRSTQTLNGVASRMGLRKIRNDGSKQKAKEEVQT